MEKKNTNTIFRACIFEATNSYRIYDGFFIPRNTALEVFQKSLATQISKNTTPKSNIDTQNDVFLLKMYLRLQASFWVSSRSFFGGVDGVQNGKTSDFPMIFGHTNPQ